MQLEFLFKACFSQTEKRQYIFKNTSWITHNYVLTIKVSY